MTFTVWESIKKTVLNAVWPVNSIYISFDHINPAAKFVGTWVRISDSFLYGISKDAEIGKTGGEAEHTLTVDEMPKHTHGVGIEYTVTSGHETPRLSSNTVYASAFTSAAGGDQSHNNMPPYIQVSIWRRIS